MNEQKQRCYSVYHEIDEDFEEYRLKDLVAAAKPNLNENFADETGIRRY